jgi:riboflavin synthase
MWLSTAMFTGLIEATAEVLTLELVPGGGRLVLASELVAALTPGDSVAVNGVCLTAVERTEGEVAFELGPETLRVSALGDLTPGRRVNLERAIRADARLGGHIVQGHVDGVGTITGLRRDGEFVWISIAFPPELAHLMVEKGAIAVDGISLTIAALHRTSLEVQVIPFTLSHTTLSSVHPRSRVNLECDIVGKYVARSLALGAAAQLEQPS